VRIHYPLVVAAGYVGLMVWHGGLSGSAPLKVTSLADLAGVVGPETAARIGPIAISRTLGSPLNLAIGAGLAVALPGILWLLAPRRAEAMREAPDEVLRVSEEAAADRAAAGEPPRTPGERLDRSRLLGLGMAAAGLVWVGVYLAGGGWRRLDPNGVNLAFLFLGMALHGTPARYVRAVEQAVRGCAGIILQFPFYAGIMGLMQGTGLVEVFAGWTNAVATARTLPALTFLAAALVNLFVPSGGGQWAIQGPIVLRAALALDVPPEKVVMALAYGDELTNMLQPFWALPLLGLTGLRAGDIMGYTMVVMVLALPVYATPLYFL
jgi:short-chain fatty acids transporter